MRHCIPSSRAWAGRACRLQAGRRASGDRGRSAPSWSTPNPSAKTATRSARSSRVTKAICRSASPARCSPGSSMSERAVKQGDTLATLDTQDYQNRLRSAEADVSSAEAALVEAQGNGGAARQALEGRLDAEGDLRHRAAQPARRRGQAHRRQGQSRLSPATSSTTPSSRPISTA